MPSRRRYSNNTSWILRQLQFTSCSTTAGRSRVTSSVPALTSYAGALLLQAPQYAFSTHWEEVPALSLNKHDFWACSVPGRHDSWVQFCEMVLRDADELFTAAVTKMCHRWRTPSSTLFLSLLYRGRHRRCFESSCVFRAASHLDLDSTTIWFALPYLRWLPSTPGWTAFTEELKGRGLKVG